MDDRPRKYSGVQAAGERPEAFNRKSAIGVERGIVRGEKD
jgi:hypothetical protein